MEESFVIRRQAKKGVSGVEIVVGVVLATQLLLSAGCTGVTDEAVGSKPPLAEAPAAMQPVNRAIILDTTGSTDERFCHEVMACVIAEVGSFGGEASDLNNGAEGIPALDLWVFAVGRDPTASYTTAKLHVKLPEVVGIAPRPSTNDDAALDAIHAWNTERDRYLAEAAEWAVARDRAVVELEAFDLTPGEASGIYSTVIAAASVMPPGADLLIASDLIEGVGAPSINVAIDSSRVTVVQPSPKGMERADACYAETVTFLTNLGVDESHITRYRGEQVPEAVSNFMRL